MEILEIITIDEHEKWDEKVKSFKNYDVAYLSGYAKAFQLHGDGEPLLFYYNDGSTKAINVAMKRDIAQAEPFKGRLPLGTWFDLSTPYGYGGFIFEGENYKAVSTAYDRYCREQGFISEFVRFHLFSDYQNSFSGTIKAHAHNVVRSLDISLDEMTKEFDYQVRRNLKRAVAAGMDVEIDTTGERLDDFLNIYYSTMNRTNAKDEYFFSKEFFETFNKMGDNVVYFHALCEGKVASTELVIYGNENCYSFLCGTNPEFFKLRPNNFLKYEIIKWAKQKGLKRFILGGGYRENDGIFWYKKTFAPSGIYDFYIGKKIYNEEKYWQLTDIRRAAGENGLDEDFFPLYRAALEEAELAPTEQGE